MATPVFDHAHSKINEITFSFPELAPACKKSVHSSHFRVPWLDWPHLFLTIPTHKVFDQLLIYVNLYQYAKSQAISLICSGNTVD